MTENLEAKSENKNEMKRLEVKKSVFEEKDPSHFITNKDQIFFQSIGIHDVIEHCKDFPRSHTNTRHVVNDIAER